MKSRWRDGILGTPLPFWRSFLKTKRGIPLAVLPKILDSGFFGKCREAPQMTSANFLLFAEFETFSIQEPHISSVSINSGCLAFLDFFIILFLLILLLHPADYWLFCIVFEITINLFFVSSAVLKDHPRSNQFKRR